MNNYLFWTVVILLSVFILPNIIDHVIMTNTIKDFSETPLVNGEYNNE